MISNTAGNTAQDVEYTDTVDPNTTLNCSPLARGTTQGAITCPSGPENPDTLFVNVGDIEGGGSVTITFQVIIDRPLSSGVTQVLNQGFIHGSNFATEPTDDPDTGVEDDATVTPVLGVAIDPLEKTDSLLIDADGNGIVSSGDTLLYEVTFWNKGDMDATDVIFTDVPDTYTHFVVGTITCDKPGSWVITDTPKLVEVYVGTVSGDSSEMVTITVQVKIPSSIPGYVHYIYNQAIVSSNEESPVRSNDPETPIGYDPTRTSFLYTGAVPVFPNLYVGVAAALMAGILAYFLRRRFMRQ